MVASGRASVFFLQARSEKTIKVLNWTLIINEYQNYKFIV